jgi:starch-binding outer membrane protein, SusD/RagB family
MKKKYIVYLTGMLLTVLMIIPSCDLNEVIKDELTAEVVQKDTNLLPNVVAAPLGQLRDLWWRQRVWGFQEATSDECFFPARGSDWYDGGVWIADYTLAWTPMHRDVIDTWNALSNSLSSSNMAIYATGHEQETEPLSTIHYRAQAIFLRSFYEYNMFDLYRTYPTRDPFDLDFLKAPEIHTGAEGFNRITAMVRSILPTIVERNMAKYGEPNKDAALMLLAKLYLNEYVYTGTAGYDSCLIYLNGLINSGNYSLANNYFNMFSVDNDKNYKNADDEGIFVSVFNDDQDYGADNNVQWVLTTFHYRQTLGSSFSGWNGCCATQGYLNTVWLAGTDTATDVRWKDNSIKPQMGVNLGFNYGQQYNPKTGKALRDRNNKPLIFTFDCPLSGADEPKGVRVLKYPPRAVPVNIMRTPNDYLIWRYADALLMKAECEVRSTVNQNIPDALAIVNEIRTKRNAPLVTAVTADEMLNKIYIERGLELYWEGHRRQDMIRFGKYLDQRMEWPVGVAPNEDAYKLPIPASAIAGMPGNKLKQNHGYN